MKFFIKENWFKLSILVIIIFTIFVLWDINKYKNTNVQQNSNTVQVVNYSQNEKDCSKVGEKIEEEENKRLGNTFPNDDDHNDYVVSVSNHFNRRDNKCYIYYENYNRAEYQKGFNFRYSHNADEFWMSRLIDGYEKTNIIGCGAGTFSDNNDGCIYWLENSRDVGGANDPNSEFNLKLYEYYMKN